jgi:hypothetical protein
MTKRHAVFASLALLGLAACGGDTVSPSTSTTALAPRSDAASSGAVVVTESDISRQADDTPPLRSWVLYTRALGTGTFVTGPGTPPLGVGSFEMATPTGADKATLFNFDHIGTRLGDIRSMSYATYRSAGALQQVASINIQVDYNGPDVAGGFTTLVFEPVYNTSQGAVVSNQWQSWDAYDGGQAIWWSSNPIPGAPNRDTFVPWSTIVAANPNATILGGYGVNQGSGNPALVTAVDALHFDTPSTSITYDFEPYRVATNKDACKNDGWKTVRRADGSEFKNQGDCVSYTSNGR